jgi:hypothetical protein
MIVATRAAQQLGLLVRKHFKGGRSWTGMKGFQSNTIKHKISIEMITLL